MLSMLVTASALALAPSILVADGLSPKALSVLGSRGAHVVEKHHAPEELAAALAEYDAVIIRSATTLGAEAIREGATGRLRVIGRAGVGVDNIDLAAAREARCWVLNSPGGATTSVVELTLAHMLAAARGLQDADLGLKTGRWLKGQIRIGADGGPRAGHELAGKRLGLLGFGRIGKGVASAASALGMQVHAFSRGAASRPEEARAAAELGVTLSDSAEALFRACSHVVVLCALNDETRGLVDARLIGQMQEYGADGTRCGAHLFNLARGGIVVEKDAARCLEQGTLATYCTDVFEREPPASDNPLLTAPNFHATPHVGAATPEAQARVGLQIAEAVLCALGGEHPPEGVVVAPGGGD